MRNGSARGICFIFADYSECLLSPIIAKNGHRATKTYLCGIGRIEDDAGGGTPRVPISQIARPAYPLSAKTRWMNGKMHRETRRSGPPPSRSWILAGCGSSTRPRPSVSTSAWRLRPLIFFPANVHGRWLVHTDCGSARGSAYIDVAAWPISRASLSAWFESASAASG